MARPGKENSLHRETRAPHLKTVTHAACQKAIDNGVCGESKLNLPLHTAFVSEKARGINMENLLGSHQSEGR
jgi:hypothetical protein